MVLSCCLSASPLPNWVVLRVSRGESALCVAIACSQGSDGHHAEVWMPLAGGQGLFQQVQDSPSVLRVIAGTTVLPCVRPSPRPSWTHAGPGLFLPPSSSTSPASLCFVTRFAWHLPPALPGVALLTSCAPGAAPASRAGAPLPGAPPPSPSCSRFRERLLCARALDVCPGPVSSSRVLCERSRRERAACPFPTAHRGAAGF